MSKRNKLRKSLELKQTATLQKVPVQVTSKEPSEVIVQNQKPVEIPFLQLMLSGDDLFVTDPAKAHTVKLPCDLNGLRLLKLMLRAKQAVPHEKQKLGSSAMPTQRMVEEFLRNKELEEQVEQEEIMNELKELF